MSRPRVKVAAVSDRLPKGALERTSGTDEASASTASPKKSTGRPKKAAGTKAKGVTVTLWPHELEAFEHLRAQVNDGLPAEVSRSDLARLAFSLLIEMKPTGVREALARLRK